MSKDTCIKANTYCPVHKGIVGADCWHDSKDFSVPRTDWKQVDEINTLREQVKKLENRLNKDSQEFTILCAKETEKVLREQLAALAEQNEKLTEAYDQCGRTVQDYGRTIDQTESRLREVATHCANVEEKLAAHAEQNEKMRKVLLRLACLGNGDQYGNSIGNCIAQEALSLPDLASPVLNRIRAEGMRMAADICSEKHSLSGAEEAIRARAAELEKTND